MSAIGTRERRMRPTAARPLTASLLALAQAVALSGCGAGNIPAGPQAPAGLRHGAETCVVGTIDAEGSSAQQSAMDRWRTIYQANCRGARISYEPTGSGAGIQEFIDGRADVAASETPLLEDEQRAADKRCGAGPAIHLPMVVGQIAIIYHVPGLLNLRLRPATLAKIFIGSATRWDDPAVRADNPTAVLPPNPIHAVHRTDSSGTTDNFTSFLATAAPDEWKFGRGRDWKAPGGTGARGTSGVAEAVREGENTISYVELSGAQSASLNVAGIDSGSGAFLKPTSEGAERTIGRAKIQVRGNDIRMEVDYARRTPVGYPIVMVGYEIVCQKGLEPGKAALTRSFLTYTASTVGQRELPALGYASLPESMRVRVASAIDSIG
jgi:phosphate transport system substrate-binding protein